MADPNDALAQSIGLTYRAPLREKIARKVGFSYPPFPNMDDLDKDARFTAGYLVINCHLKLTFWDRVLVLLGGNIAVRNFVKTDVRVGMSTTRGGWSVLEGGAEFK
jgi:hypothetical protein